MPNEPRDLYWTLDPFGGGGGSVKAGGLTLLTKVAFLLSGLQNLADISTWPSEWHVLRSFCRAGDRRWEKRNRWTASPGKHRRTVYFYSIFFERVKDTLMAGISLIHSDVDLSWSFIKKKILWRCGDSNPGPSACEADALLLSHTPDELPNKSNLPGQLRHSY